VRGNLDYAVRRAGAEGTGLDEVIDLLGLAPLLARATTHLSGGERQRVALGRALLCQPRLLLMDEPLSSLDAASKAEILPYLERLHRALSIPTLYVSHDAGEIARLADHVLYIEDGRMVPASATALDEAQRALTLMSAAEKDQLALAAILAGLGTVI
jgi:molybdate transport system ATP-binding protein